MKKILISMFIGLILLPVINAGENGEGLADQTALYAGFGTTLLDGQAVISLNARLGLELANWLEIGIEADVYHTLERSYSDEQGRSYQAESGSSGLFIHSNWTLLEKLKAGVLFSTGTRMVQFRYSGQLRDQLTWTEEILDQIMVVYNSIALTMEYELCPVHSLFLETGYRHLHPFSTDYLEDEASTGGVFAALYYGVQL